MGSADNLLATAVEGDVERTGMAPSGDPVGFGLWFFECDASRFFGVSFEA